MLRLRLPLTMTIAILAGSACGGSVTTESTSGGSSSGDSTSSGSSSGGSSSGGQNQPSISDLFGHDWLFLADRALKKGTQPSAPNGELTEADYEPLPQVKSYPVSFTVDGASVTIGDAPYVGAWDQVPGAARSFKLSDGTFAGGRFDVWPGDAAIGAELTIYGSGVPIISSERGKVVGAN